MRLETIIAYIVNCQQERDLRIWSLFREKFPDKPALVVELKWDKSAKGAISQIKQKQYCKSLEEYAGNILLAGINYSKKDKEHQCMIEKIVK